MASRRKRRRVPAPAPAPAPSAAALQIWYIESSALVAAFLESDAAAQDAIRAPGRHVTSALTLAESQRAVLRARLTGRLNTDQERRAIRGLNTFARRCELVNVSSDVLVRAGRPFPVEPVRTLDAIHLASLELLGEAPQLVTIVTRDRRVASNGRALGYGIV